MAEEDAINTPPEVKDEGPIDKRMMQRRKNVSVLGINAVFIVIALSIIFMAFSPLLEEPVFRYSNEITTDVGDKALAWTLLDVDENAHDFDDIINNTPKKPMLLEFFATTCSHCRKMMEPLQKVYDAYSENITMISIASSVDDIDSLSSFLDEFGPSWTHLLSYKKTFADYKIEGTPTTILIDCSGTIQYRHAGILEYETLSEEVEAVIGDDCETGGGAGA